MARSKALTRAVRRYETWKRQGQEEVSYSNRFMLQLGVCAALFLVIFGLKQVQAEPVQQALSQVRSVATTEMELGRSIGKLEFVGNFVPESVMVFWNAGEKGLCAPLESSSMLLESDDGWAWFEGDGALLSGGEGKVESVEPCADGGFRLTIAYDNGLTGVMEPLKGVRVAAGDRVHEGQSVGLSMQAGQAAQVKVKVLSGEVALKASQWLR